VGVYQRKDSQFWWLLIEGTSIRESTGIPVDGGSSSQSVELRRQAQAIYAVRKLNAVKSGQGFTTARPVISFTDFAAWYTLHHAAHHRGATREASIVRQLSRYFDRFDSLTLITEAVAKEWMTWRKQQVQPSTVNRELDVLKQLLKAAVPKYLPANPATGLRRFRVKEAEPRVLTREEESRLFEVGSPEDRAWLVVALDTLMRLSNVVYLKWPQVKRAQSVIVPLNAKVSHDAVPITLRMAQALDRLTRTAEWVFPSFHVKGHGKTAAKNLAIRRFARLCALADVPHGRHVNGVTFHGLRHTGATRALQNGASVRTVMKLGGWRDEGSVMRYVHAADSDVRAAAESISRPTLVTPPARRRKLH
jgi:integrase